MWTEIRSHVMVFTVNQQLKCFVFNESTSDCRLIKIISQTLFTFLHSRTVDGIIFSKFSDINPRLFRFQKKKHTKEHVTFVLIFKRRPSDWNKGSAVGTSRKSRDIRSGKADWSKQLIIQDVSISLELTNLVPFPSMTSSSSWQRKWFQSWW